MRTKEQAKLYRQSRRAQHREEAKRYRAKHKERLSLVEKLIRQTPKRRAYIKEYQKRHYIPHPRPRLKYLTSEEQTKKRKARVSAQSALIQGILQKKSCSVCGNEKSQMHHPDYSKPFEVIWVCRIHHLEIHTGKATSGD